MKEGRTGKGRKGGWEKCRKEVMDEGRKEGNNE